MAAAPEPLSSSAGHRGQFRVALSVQSPLPISWHPARGSWHWLVERVVLGRDQLGAVEVLLRRVVPEPILVRLVTPDNRGRFVGRMVTCVLGWR